MGQKVNPNVFRLGIINKWQANWYVDRKDFAKSLEIDTKVRLFLNKALAKSSIASITIERPASKSISVAIKTSRPGMLIGRKGNDLTKIESQLIDIAGIPVKLKVLEVKAPDINAKLVADNVASQLERRVLFRRAMKRAMQSAMRTGAAGIKIRVSGRLSGAEIARSEWYREGRIPLHTLRADIDYAVSEAKTSYGIIGVKVWIFKNEVLRKRTSTEKKFQKNNKIN